MTYVSQPTEQWTHHWVQSTKGNDSLRTSMSGSCGMELAVVESCFKLHCVDGNSVAMEGNSGSGDTIFPSVCNVKQGNGMSFHSDDSLATQGVNSVYCNRDKTKLSQETTESTPSPAHNNSMNWNNNSPENQEPIFHVSAKNGYEDEVVQDKEKNVQGSSHLPDVQTSNSEVTGEKSVCAQQSTLKSTGQQGGASDLELQCTAMIYPPFGNSTDVAHFVKKEDVLLDVLGNQNQGIASSMGWAGHHSLVHFDSLKVVPELLVERIRQEDSLIRDVFHNGGNYQIGPHKSICASSTTAGAFHSHWGITNSCGVKSYGGSSSGKQSGTFCDFSNSLHSAIRQTCKPQNESSKNPQFVNNEQNISLKQTSNFGRNMNSNFMCRTMFLMNDNIQNNSRVHGKNIFAAPSESGPFMDPKCNFDANAFCCGTNGLVFGDKHVAAKHQLTSCGMLQPPVPVDCADPAKRGSQGGCTSQQGGVQTEQPSSCDQRVTTEDGRGGGGPKDPTKCPTKPKERPFSCEECGKSFLLKHHLTTHTRVHTGERPYICTECGKSFAHKHCLVTHQRLHTGERPYTCLECKKSFTLKHHLVTHTRVHSRDRPFACEECGRTFSQKRHLVTHAKLHTGERPFACDECGESFSQKEHLTTHSRFHGGERPYVCPDCGNAFQRKFQLVSHARLHGKRPYSCHLCGKEFLQKRTLVAHTRLHTGERPFACQHCGEAFGRKCELAVHSRAAHTSGGRSFACRECGNCFASREGLALHLRLHAGERSLVTDLCGLAFPLERGNAAAASRVQGIGMVTGAMTSDGRGVVGSTSSSSSASGGAATQPTVPHKPHLCLQCGKSFAQKHGLVQHTKRHSGERPHACNKCGKTFAQKYSLSLHSRLHPPTQTDSNGAEHHHPTPPPPPPSGAVVGQQPPRPIAASPPSIQHQSSPAAALLHSSPPAIQHSGPQNTSHAPSGEAQL